MTITETTTVPAIPLPRQTCRGHLERGLGSFTVGTMPNGEVRPYVTELVRPLYGFDLLRFHYCAECAQLPQFTERLSAPA